MATRCAKGRRACEGACPGNSRLAIFGISFCRRLRAERHFIR